MTIWYHYTQFVIKHNPKAMHLKDYLSENKYTQRAFISDVYVQTGHKFSQGTIAKYILGQRIPRKNEMMIIHNFTKGIVQPNDFYLS